MTIRYSKKGGTPPSLSTKITKIVENATANDSTLSTNVQSKNIWLIPANAEGKMSGTSDASDCFVKRQNCKNIQSFLLDYTYKKIHIGIFSGEL